MDYHAKLANHLTVYKEFELGIGRGGAASPFPALPGEYGELNILSGCRRPYRRYVRGNPMGRLQRNLHYLHSSQVLCFNLFFPFVQDKAKHPLLLTLLGRPQDTILHTWFEHSFGSQQSEVFDFVIELAGGQCLFFDVKLAEKWFGPEDKCTSSSAELSVSQQDEVVGMVPRALLTSPDVAKYIVLLQKMAYVAGGGDRRMVVLFPRGNKELLQAMTRFHSSLYPTIREKLSVLYLEDFIRDIRAQAIKTGSDLASHYARLEKKYVVGG